MAVSNKKTPVKRKRAFLKHTKSKKTVGLSTNWKFILLGVALILLSPFYYGYVLKTFSSAFRWIKDIGQDPNYRTYTDFNIPIPGTYTVHGIDVSWYQGKINWKKVKAMNEDGVQITFAFIKATEGLLSVDPYFQRNWREAAKAGIICGAYHFFKPRKSGKWQAVFFNQTVKTEKGDLPMVVDVEVLDGASPVKMRKELLAFLIQLEKKTSVKPIVYTNIKFYENYLKGYINEYTLWIAHYYKPKLKVSTKTNWQFWQHSDKATVDGINHVVDMNVFRGDSAALQHLLIQ